MGWYRPTGTASVDFYLDGGSEPFASSAEPPYQVRWQVRGSGCRTVQAQAVDAAGNAGESSAVSFCMEDGG